MTRVAVIGNAGGGKSTMCRKLGKALDLTVYPVDQIQWKPGWVKAAAAEFRRRHEQWLARERWIIDGWGPWEAIEARFEAADTIIFVDHPLFIHYWWAFKRQFKCLFRPRPDGPEGCPMLPMTWQLIKVIWDIHWSARPRLSEQLSCFQTGYLDSLSKGDAPIYPDLLLRVARRSRRILHHHFESFPSVLTAYGSDEMHLSLTLLTGRGRGSGQKGNAVIK